MSGQETNPIFAQQLSEMGYPLAQIYRALQATRNAGVVQAIEWLAGHADDPEPPATAPEPPPPPPALAGSPADRLRLLQERLRKTRAESARHMASTTPEEKRRQIRLARLKEKQDQQRNLERLRSEFRANHRTAPANVPGTGTGGTAAVTGGSATAPPRPAAGESGSATLQFRFPPGSQSDVARHTFPGTTTLHTVLDYLQSRMPLGRPVRLRVLHTRTAYEGVALGLTTLRDASLVPSGLVAVEFDGGSFPAQVASAWVAKPDDQTLFDGGNPEEEQSQRAYVIMRFHESAEVMVARAGTMVASAGALRAERDPKGPSHWRRTEMMQSTSGDIHNTNKLTG
ncbi:hypothetical protein PAPYR_4659 [Paratrimastix pyriformis]|uniref:UBA domain-containing protein n=1 Tax=Paratrimastix pyriformis TaxID=342808 RepID=A0ABQ8UJG1_9EUKA|nr:hypothetical protein PAPYR_4659 [Paratrimastix pyriformis]